MIRKRLGVLYRYCLPNKIQPRVDCYRAINSWRGAEAIFIHVPKVAGVSVSMSLYDKTLGHIRACDIKKYYPEDFENFFSFAFVREPSERFLSAIKYLDLNYQRLKGSPGMPSNRSLLTDPDRLVDQWLLHQDMSTVNNVFKRQSDFLCDESGNLFRQRSRLQKRGVTLTGHHDLLHRRGTRHGEAAQRGDPQRVVGRDDPSLRGPRRLRGRQGGHQPDQGD